MIGWPLALLLFVVGAVLAVVLGRGWVPTRYRPLAGFVLVVIAAGLVVSLNETWRRHHELRDERMQVVMVLREMRTSVADYRRALARSIAADEERGPVANRAALSPGRLEIPAQLAIRIEHHPLLLKHASSVSYSAIANLVERIAMAQEALGDADDAEWIRSVTLMERDVELLDKVLAWESLYQQGIFSLAQLTGFVEQLGRSRTASG